MMILYVLWLKGIVRVFSDARTRKRGPALPFAPTQSPAQALRVPFHHGSLTRRRPHAAACAYRYAVFPMLGPSHSSCAPGENFTSVEPSWPHFPRAAATDGRPTPPNGPRRLGSYLHNGAMSGSDIHGEPPTGVAPRNLEGRRVDATPSARLSTGLTTAQTTERHLDPLRALLCCRVEFGLATLRATPTDRDSAAPSASPKTTPTVYRSSCHRRPVCCRACAGDPCCTVCCGDVCCNGCCSGSA